MSRLYFSTEDETVELKGWEFHWLGGLSDKVSLGVINAADHKEQLAAVMNPGHYAAQRQSLQSVHWGTTFEAAIRADRGDLLVWRGRKIGGRDVMWNTALATGSDAVKLATRLYPQAEVHAWIAESDRVWVANMIEDALAAGVYRTARLHTDRHDEWVPSGWDKVIDLLRAGPAGPVVTHYSITEWFPNHQVAGMDWEGWEDHSRPDQWAMAMAGLTKGRWSKDWPGLRIGPDDWRTFRFGAGVDAFDLYADDRNARMDRKMGTRPATLKIPR